jgi:hypothetical protein
MSKKKTPLETLDKILMQKIGAGNISSLRQDILTAYNSGLEGEELNQKISQVFTNAGIDNPTSLDEPLPLVVAIYVK